MSQSVIFYQLLRDVYIVIMTFSQVTIDILRKLVALKVLI